MASSIPMTGRRRSSPPPSDAVRSLAWTAAIEQQTTGLPHRRGLARYRRREYVHDERTATVVGFRGSELLTALASSTRAPAAGSAPTVRSQATADVVVADAMRTPTLLRFRSFYLAPARSLVVQRRHHGTRTPLAVGSDVQRSVAGRTPFVVPEIIDAGFSLPTKADWVVEQAIDGLPVAFPDAAATVHELLALLPELWRVLGTETGRLDETQRVRTVQELTALAHRPPDGLWPADVDRESAARRVRDLLTDDRSLIVGLSHGDPGLGNVLRLPDGGLALVDWEDAGHRPVAHDVVKVLLSAPDPVATSAALTTPSSLRATLAAPGVMPWRRQVATALAVFLRGWRYRHSRAVKRGSTRISQRRMHTMLRVLNALLDD